MVRRTLVGVVAVAGVLASSAGVAVAGETVTQAIRAQDRIVHSNPAYRSLEHFDIKTAAQAEAAIPKFEAVEKLVSNAANTVAGATATSAEKAGQHDWVSGARDVAKGVGVIIVAFKDIEDGKDAAAKTEALDASKLLKAGNVIGTKGDKLLHLPTSD